MQDVHTLQIIVARSRRPFNMSLYTLYHYIHYTTHIIAAGGSAYSRRIDIYIIIIRRVDRYIIIIIRRIDLYVIRRIDLYVIIIRGTDIYITIIIIDIVALHRCAHYTR